MKFGFYEMLIISLYQFPTRRQSTFFHRFSVLLQPLTPRIVVYAVREIAATASKMVRTISKLLLINRIQALRYLTAML